MRVIQLLFVLFLLMPIIEIYFLIKVGELIGVWPTIVLVVLTAVIGSFLLRHQGIATLARFQRTVVQGKLPATEMVEGILLAVGGALLMTPGFVTDAMGFACLFPVSRKWLAKLIIKRSEVHIKSGIHAKMQGFEGDYSERHGFDEKHEHSRARQDTANNKDEAIIEGEFTEVETDPIGISPSKKGQVK